MCNNVFRHTYGSAQARQKRLEEILIDQARLKTREGLHIMVPHGAEILDIYQEVENALTEALCTIEQLKQDIMAQREDQHADA